MARSYNKLWKRLIDEKMTRTDLRKAAGITTNALAKLGKDESVPIETLEKICAVLDCSIDDILEITEEPEKKKPASRSKNKTGRKING